MLWITHVNALTAVCVIWWSIVSVHAASVQRYEMMLGIT